MTYPDLKNKRVLITGASGGIGQAIARQFAESGAHVGIHFFQHEKAAKELLQSIRKSAGFAEIFQADLLNAAALRRLVPSFIKKFGGIDILINNAGAVIGTKHFSELDEKSWDATLHLNLKAAFFLSQNAFIRMKKQNEGRIINISSVAAKYGGSPTSLHYGIAKAGLETLGIGLARAGAPYNILVNTVRGGFIETDFHKKMKRTSSDTAKRIDLIPLKRAGTPDDMASTVLFLASSCGNFITGQTLSVSGGD